MTEIDLNLDEIDKNLKDLQNIRNNSLREISGAGTIKGESDLNKVYNEVLQNSKNNILNSMDKTDFSQNQIRQMYQQNQASAQRISNITNGVSLNPTIPQGSPIANLYTNQPSPYSPNTEPTTINAVSRYSNQNWENYFKNSSMQNFNPAAVSNRVMTGFSQLDDTGREISVLQDQEDKARKELETIKDVEARKKLYEEYERKQERKLKLLRDLLHGTANRGESSNGWNGKPQIESLDAQRGIAFKQINRVLSPAEFAAYFQSACDKAGVPNDPRVRAQWYKTISFMARNESGFNPGAVNVSDSNAVGPPALDGNPYQSSRGLLQCIPQTFAAYHAAGTSNNIYDPEASIAASINYTCSRYGVSRSGGESLENFYNNRLAGGYTGY